MASLVLMISMERWHFQSLHFSQFARLVLVIFNKPNGPFLLQTKSTQIQSILLIHPKPTPTKAHPIFNKINLPKVNQGQPPHPLPFCRHNQTLHPVPPNISVPLHHPTNHPTPLNQSQPQTPSLPPPLLHVDNPTPSVDNKS